MLPLLLLVILGIADFGFMFQRYEVITNAAREGARIAILPGYSTPDVQARVDNYLDAGRVPVAGRNPATVVDDPLTLADGTIIPMKRVTVTYSYTYMFVGAVGGWFGGSFTSRQLAAVARMRTE